MVTFPRGPFTSVSGASTGSRKAPRNPCGAAHTGLTPAPGTAQPRSSRPFGRSLSGALRTRNTGRRTSGPQPRSWRAHPACTPISPTRRPRLCEVTRRPPASCAPPVPAPALHLEPARLPSLSGTWNMSPAAQQLLACRAAVPARPRAAQGPPSTAYWMAPTPVTPPQPIAEPDFAPPPRLRGLESEALAADWWEQVPLKASSAGTGQQAGRRRAVLSWAGCTTPATCPGHRHSSRCGIVSWARAGATRLQPGGTGRGAGAGQQAEQRKGGAGQSLDISEVATATCGPLTHCLF